MITEPITRPARSGVTVAQSRPEVVLRTATALIAIVCSAAGLVDPNQYRSVVSAAVLPGAMGQDATALALGVVLLVATARRLPADRVCLPALAFIAYGYGIYSIERAVTVWYIAYLAALACATWSLVLGVSRSLRAAVGTQPVAGARRVIVAALCALTSLAFSVAWLSALLPYALSSRQPSELWSIYLLDLCFVMPALGTAAWWTWRRDPRGRALGTLMTGLGAVMMASLSLAEVCGPLVGLPAEPLAALPTLVLTVAFATGWLLSRPVGTLGPEAAVPEVAMADR
jgi:hypothetical protein